MCVFVCVCLFYSSDLFCSSCSALGPAGQKVGAALSVASAVKSGSHGDIASSLLAIAGKKGQKLNAAVKLGRMAHKLATGATKFTLATFGSGIGLLGSLIGGKFGAKLSKISNAVGTLKSFLGGGAGAAFAGFGLAFSLFSRRIKKRKMTRARDTLRALCEAISREGGVSKVEILFFFLNYL